MRKIPPHKDIREGKLLDIRKNVLSCSILEFALDPCPRVLYNILSNIFFFSCAKTKLLPKMRMLVKKKNRSCYSRRKHLTQQKNFPSSALSKFTTHSNSSPSYLTILFCVDESGKQVTFSVTLVSKRKKKKTQRTL